MLKVKRKYTASAWLIAAALMLTACAKEELSRNGQGEVILGVRYDTKTMVSQAMASKSGGQPAYTLSITDADGKKIRQYTQGDLPSAMWLLAGNYTVEAVAGEDVEAAFDAPYYVGRTLISVAANQSAQESVVCRLANAKVSVAYSDDVRAAFSAFQTTIGPVTDKLLIFDQAAAQTGYYKTEAGTGATQLRWTFSATNRSGQSYMLEGDFTAEPCTHYTLSFDIGAGGTPSEGGLTTGTIFGTITVEEDAEDMSDELVIPLKRLPTIKAIVREAEFDLNEDLFVKYATTVETRVEITGTPSIGSIGFTHDCPYLTEQYGIPASFDFADLTSAAIGKLGNAGIAWTPIGAATTIDFTGLTSKLPAGNFNFTFSVKDNSSLGKQATATLTMLVPESDVTTQSIAGRMADVWAAHATLRGNWRTAEQPENLAFQYKKAGDMVWTKVTEGLVTDDASTGAFSLTVKGLEPGTVYNFRAMAGDGPGNTQTFTTEAAQHIPDLNFDNWYQESGNNKPWYSTTQAEFLAKSFWFDSGNPGLASYGYNPTTGEASDVYKEGGKAARLLSQEVSIKIIITVKKFAAGNIFTGRYNSTVISLTDPGAKLDFGRPYTARPTKLKGYYKYTPAMVSHTKTGVGPNGVALKTTDRDYCQIYIALCDWGKEFTANTATGTFPNWNGDNIIAYGEFTTNATVSSYTEVEIPLVYRDVTRKPTYIMITGSASWFGDYFVGGNGSVLLMDEFELVFE